MITLDAVSARRAELDPAAGARRAGRALLTAAAALLVGIGWVAARVVTVVIATARLAWAGLLWCLAAAELGYRDVRPKKEKK